MRLGAPQASFDLRVWMGTDDVTLSGQCGPTDGTGPHLSFSFTIKPDGQSELSSFKYTVPPQA